MNSKAPAAGGLAVSLILLLFVAALVLVLYIASAYR